MSDAIKAQMQKDLADFPNDFAQHYGESDDEDLLEFGRTQVLPAKKEEPNAVAKAAGAVAADVGMGLAQSPRSVVRGVTKGVNSMMGFLDSTFDFQPDVTLLNEEGQREGVRVTTRGEADKRREKQNNTERAAEGKPPVDTSSAPQFPVIDKPATNTVTGGLIEGISQFAVGLKGVDKLAKVAAAGAAGETAALAGAKLLEKGFGQSLTKGALADLLAFDEHEQRLSNVIQQVPALQNPVTKYLAADEDDSFLEGKLKQAVEGTVTGAAGEALFNGIKLLRKGMAAKRAVEAEGGKIEDIVNMPIQEKLGQTLPKEKLNVLGDPDVEELLIKRQFPEQPMERAASKMKAAAKATAGKTPDMVGDAAASDLDGGIRINFARIEGPEDIARVMQEMANDPDLIAGVQKARRGVRTDEEMLKEADDIDGFADLMQRRTGETFNDSQIVAARKLYYDTTDRMIEAAKKAAAPDASDLDQYAFRKMMAVHHAVQQEVLGVRAEAARALRAWALPMGGTDGEKIRAIEGVLDNFGGAEATKDLAQRMAAISSTGRLTTAQINQLTNGGAFARTGKALTEAWTLGLLTSPRTHIVNVTSNFLTGLFLGAEKATASLMKDTPVTMKEAVEYYAGFFGSMKEAMGNAAQAWRTGQTGIGLGKLDLPAMRSTSKEVLDPNGKAGIFSKGIDLYGAMLNRYVGGSLAAGDEMAKTMLYKGQIRALAVRDANRLGLDGADAAAHISKMVSDPPAALRADAVEFANYGTYTKALEGGGAALQRMIVKWPAARFVVPFVRTPVNIFKFTFDRTPLALVTQSTRDDIMAGGLRRASALAKLGTGTSVMFMGFDQAANGNITGAGPVDPKARSKLLGNGWKPYSIRIGDKYYSYARFEPAATWLGMSADMAEILTNYEAYDMEAQDEADELVLAAVAAISNQVVGKTFLSGVSDITQLFSDTKRYGPQFLQRYAGSLVPNAVADIEKALSPEQEQVFNMIDAMKARIPGLSDQVGKRRNVYGEVIQNYYPDPKNPAMATAESVMQAFNPVYFTDKDMPKNKLDQWFLQNGFEGPNMPQKMQRFEVPGSFAQERVAVNLRDYPEVYDRFMQLRGEMTLPQYYGMTLKQYLGALVDKRVPDSGLFFNPMASKKEDQERYISKISQDYDTAIRAKLVDEFSVLRQSISEARNRQRQMDANRGSNGLNRTKSFP